MKKIFSLLAACALLFTGCGTLIPKQVEFFQAKVKKFPEQSDTLKEDQRKAAALAGVRATETYLAAIKENSSTNVTAPAKDAVDLTHSVSTSLGPPKQFYQGKNAAKNYVDSLNYDVAKFNGKVEDYKDREDKYAGKKIEGTGFIQIGYFTYIGLILLVLFLLWTGLKLYGTANPIVGAGTSLVGRVSSSVLSRAVSEITAGGEEFKQELATSGLAADVQAKVLALFSNAHRANQSSDVQKVVQTLTV
jgi:hypothetical protein